MAALAPKTGIAAKPNAATPRVAILIDFFIFFLLRKTELIYICVKIYTRFIKLALATYKLNMLVSLRGSLKFCLGRVQKT